MRILKLIFLIVTIAIVGCQSAVTHKGVQSQLDTVKLRRKKIVQYPPHLSCNSTIINNEFSLDILRFKVFKAGTNKIKSLFLNHVNLRFEKQKNSEGGFYSLYQFSDGINTLKLYNNEGFYLEEGDIKNDKFLLNKKITIGMKRDEFLKLIKETKIKCDTITVTDDESTFEAVYIFKNSKLQHIKLGQILE